MEPQSNEQSPSPSSSEEMESDGDSEHEDEMNNDKDSDAEDQNENDKDNSDNSDEDDDDDDDEDDEDNDDDDDDDESDAEEGEEENAENSKPTPEEDKNSESPYKKSSNSNGGLALNVPRVKGNKAKNYNLNKSIGDPDCYLMDDLPLEVITTVEPTTYSYPVLKNMSNGVLTQRNIFTEHERGVLKEIINKYRNIVDTRSRTREIYLEKQSVWQQIVEEYNSTENIMVRTEKELRKCWDNMKYRAKQAEKGLIKLEKFEVDKFDNSFDGMDLQTLTQQVIEDAFRFQHGGTTKTEQQLEPQVKIEPQYHELSGGNKDDGYSNLDPPEEENGLSGDEEREPALKKARQESPKLSSLLLAASHKSSSSKKDGKNREKSINSNKIPYNIPECTKVLHMKKKNSHQNSVNTSNGNGEFPVSILPKGLAACLSITNIPNPVNVANHISPNYSYPHKDGNLPSMTSPLQNAMKPMPSLKKMVPGKNQTNGNCKNLSSRSSKKSSSSYISREQDRRASSPTNVNIGNGAGSLNAVQSINNLISSTGLSSDNNNCESPEKLMSLKLTSQRIEFERQEHEVRMKLLEKELQSQTYQSQYWALRLKLLRSGRENNAFNLAGATNGDID